MFKQDDEGKVMRREEFIPRVRPESSNRIPHLRKKEVRSLEIEKLLRAVIGVGHLGMIRNTHL